MDFTNPSIILSFEAAALKLGSTVNTGAGGLPGVCRLVPNTNCCCCRYGSVELFGNAFRAAAKFEGFAVLSWLPKDDDCWIMGCWVDVLPLLVPG